MVGVANGVSLKLTGVLSGTGAFTKEGYGALVLSGENTHSGATTLKAGWLTVTGSTQSPVSMVGYGTGHLGGTGTIGADVTYKSSDTINPGDLGSGAKGVGTLGIDGNLSFVNGAKWNFQLDPADQTVGASINDLLVIGGDLTLDGILNVSATSGDFLSVGLGDAWTLATYNGSLTDNVLDFGTMPALSNNYKWAIDTSKSGQVDLIVIPETGSILLGGLGLLALLRRRR